MKLLSEEVGLICQQDFGAFNLSEIKSLGLGFISSGQDRITEGGNMSAEFLSIVDDVLENLFLVGLERKIRNFVLPSLQVFQFWSSGITRNANSPITNGAGILLVILDFASGNLQTFTVIPETISKNSNYLKGTYHS